MITELFCIRIPKGNNRIEFKAVVAWTLQGINPFPAPRPYTQTTNGRSRWHQDFFAQDFRKAQNLELTYDWIDQELF